MCVSLRNSKTKANGDPTRVCTDSGRRADLVRLSAGQGRNEEGCKCEYMSTQALSSACELTPLSISRRLENLATIPGGRRRYQPIG